MYVGLFFFVLVAFFFNGLFFFEGNSRRPELARTNLVDVFLFHGDSRTQILHFPSLPNPTDQAGRISTQVNDSWWGTRGELWNGSNISYPFYWVLISSTTTLDGNEIPQATFSAVRSYRSIFLSLLALTNYARQKQHTPTP